MLHPFIEKLIGTVRHEYLDLVFFRNALDLKHKLDGFGIDYNGHSIHQSLNGNTPNEKSGKARFACAALDSYR